MPRSYILLNDKDNVIPRNRCHLIKMDSDFFKTENDNDMDNDIEIEPKTRQHVSNWTWRSGRTTRECDQTSRNIKLHKSIRKKSNQTISIWWIGNSENIDCERRMLCVTIKHNLSAAETAFWNLVSFLAIVGPTTLCRSWNGSEDILT